MHPSRTDDVVTEPAAPSFERCVYCGNLYAPHHPDGCWVCRRTANIPRRARSSRRLAAVPAQPVDQELLELARADTYYFLESFHGHPDAD